jgi:hypothetical protein
MNLISHLPILSMIWEFLLISNYIFIIMLTVLYFFPFVIYSYVTLYSSALDSYLMLNVSVVRPKPKYAFVVWNSVTFADVKKKL